MRTALRHAAESVSPWQSVGGLRVRTIAYRGGARQARHHHQEPSLSLVLAGELEETSTAMTYRAAAGSLVVKPADFWHANAYGPRGARIMQVQLAVGSELWDRPGWRYVWHDAPRLARCLIRVLTHEGPAHEEAELALWEMLEELSSSQFDARSGPDPAWWPDAVDWLDACTERTISVAAVAQQVGVHPVHLARVCRARLGCTVRQYIRQRRVLAAWRSWERGEGTLAAIALAVGFADQAHMTRAFAVELGVSPGRLRRLISRKLAC